MRNWDDTIVKLNNEYYLLNSNRAKAKRLTLMEKNGIEEVQGKYYIYLVNKENKHGKRFEFDNINLASKMYNEYTNSLSSNYMNYTYIEKGITIFDFYSFILRSDKQ